MDLKQTEAFRSCRRVSGMTQAYVAERMNMSLPTWRSREKSPEILTIEELVRFRSILEHEGKELFNEWVKAVIR